MVTNECKYSLVSDLHQVEVVLLFQQLEGGAGKNWIIWKVVMYLLINLMERKCSMSQMVRLVWKLCLDLKEVNKDSMHTTIASVFVIQNLEYSQYSLQRVCSRE